MKEIVNVKRFEKSGVWMVSIQTPSGDLEHIEVPIASAATEAEAIEKAESLLSQRLGEKAKVASAAKRGLPKGWIRKGKGLRGPYGLEVVRTPDGVFAKLPIGGWSCKIQEGSDAELCVRAEEAWEMCIQAVQAEVNKKASAIYAQAVREWPELTKNLRADWGVEVLGLTDQGTSPFVLLVLRLISGCWVQLQDSIPIRWTSIGPGGSLQINERLVPVGWKFRISTRPGRIGSGDSQTRLVVEARNRKE